MIIITFSNHELATSVENTFAENANFNYPRASTYYCQNEDKIGMPLECVTTQGQTSLLLLLELCGTQEKQNKRIKSLLMGKEHLIA